jgi:hypothetical protein
MAKQDDPAIKAYQDLVKILVATVERQGNQIQMLVETVVATANPHIAVKHDLLPVTPLSSAFDRSGLKALGEDQVATDLSDLEATSEGV